MDKKRKQELLQRALGLRHKLKVHESMKQPETHEEIAIMTVAKWDFEDEIQAIDEVLREERNRIVAARKAAFLNGAGVKPPKGDFDSPPEPLAPPSFKGSEGSKGSESKKKRSEKSG
jgi:HD-like signal output (HDOD) protein